MSQLPNLETLPDELPVPEDDGAAGHLEGLALPAVELPSTAGGYATLSALAGLSVLYVYPMTGQPGTPLPDGWDMIPGARGCTAQACTFRDHAAELSELGIENLFGISTQSTDYQTEVVDRLHLPFALLSDADSAFQRALSMPVFEVNGLWLLRRLTIIADDGIITKVFYPVFPPNQSAHTIVEYLRKTADAS